MATQPLQLHPDDVEAGDPEGGQVHGSMSHWATPSEIPAFEQGKTGPIHVVHDPHEEPGDVSDMSRYDARQFPGSNTVHVNDPSQWNGGTPQHEYTHVYEDKVRGLRNRLFEGGNRDDQDYGGTPGIEQHNREGKTIANFNPEQRAEAVGDAWASQKKVVADAKAGKLRPGEVEAFDRVKSAFHPTLQQMKNEGDETIDTHPAAPGLPPASVSGIIAPDPLLGGEWASVNPAQYDPAKHFVKPENGAKLSEEHAKQYIVKAKGNKDIARAMAKHDGHTL